MHLSPCVWVRSRRFEKGYMTYMEPVELLRMIVCLLVMWSSAALCLWRINVRAERRALDKEKQMLRVLETALRNYRI